MLNVQTIRRLLQALNEELARRDIQGEIGVCGGAAMCLAFKAREATKDVEAIFKPSKEIRNAAAKIAKSFALDEDWLNDAVKAYFHVDPPREPLLEFSHLRVWTPRADYMLAMKGLSARFDTHDREDVEFLIEYLEIQSADQVFALINRYYPHSIVPPKTQFFIEELFEKRSRTKS